MHRIIKLSFLAFLFGGLMACTNGSNKKGNEGAKDTADEQKETIETTTYIDEQSDVLASLEKEEKSAQEKRDQEAIKAAEEAEKLAKELEKKQARELADQQAKGASEAEAKKLKEKQAKEIAALKEKELADQQIREESDRIAKEQAAIKLQAEKARLAQEAKEQADKAATELLAKEAVQAKAAKKTTEHPPAKKDETITTESATSIIDKVDKNMSARSQIVTSDMVIYGKRNDRTVTSKGYSEGNTKSFTEYLSPAREKGTKMLKLDDRLWIYSPDTDRTIQLSGHMLRQSVMGSDLSYEDMMEDRKLRDTYNAKVIGNEMIDNRKTWILELTAKVDDVAYYKRKIWVDQERYVPLKEEMFAKSGQLLKKTTLTDVVKIDGRWFPKKMNYKDMLKSGKGTDFIFKEIEFNPTIPGYIFSKGSLKK